MQVMGSLNYTRIPMSTPSASLAGTVQGQNENNKQAFNKNSIGVSAGSAISSLNATLSAAALDAQSTTKKSTDNTSVDWSDPNNYLFQNIIKDPLVQRHIIQNDDGSYSLNPEPTMIDTQKESLAVQMVRMQNGCDNYGFLPGDPLYKQQAEVVEFTAGDQAKFKELTGYNFVFGGGQGNLVCDDEGNPVPAEDAARVQEMFEIFDMAAGNRGFGTPKNDLGLSELTDVAMNFRARDGANTKLIDELLEVIKKSFAEANEQLAEQAEPKLPA